MKNILVFTVLLIFSNLLNASAQSETGYKCPENIAFMHNNLISEGTTITLKDIYKKLGCKTSFVGLPGKRALIGFNRFKFSGETVRIEAIEEQYSTPFIKSDIPLFLLTKSLWTHPTLKTNATGYLLGVIWHEQYIKDKVGVAFRSGPEMYEAYNKRKIGSFLANDYAVYSMIKEKKFKQVPIHKQTLESVPMYHYLHTEFSLFMSAFSAYIKAHKPFTEFMTFSN